MHASDSSDEDVPESDSEHKERSTSSGAQLEGATGNSEKPEDTESVSRYKQLPIME